MINRLIARLSVRAKIALIISIILVPLVAVTAVAFSLLGSRLLGSLERAMAEEKRTVYNAFIGVQHRTTIYASLVATHYEVQRGIYFDDTGVILKFLGPLNRLIGADVVTVHDRAGVIIAQGHAPGVFNVRDTGHRGLQLAREGRTSRAIEPYGPDLLVRTTVPVHHMNEPGRILGSVTLGYFLDSDLARELRRQTGAEILLTRNGRIFASSLGEPLAARQLVSGQRSLRAGGRRLDLESIPIGTRGPDRVELHLAVDHSSLRRALGWTLVGLVVAFLVTAAAGLVVALVTGRHITAATGALLTATTAMARQEFDAPLQLPAHDEFGLLAATFNRMAGSLKEDFQTIRAQTRQIELLKNYLTNIIESMPSMLVATDERGIVTQWNQAAVAFSGVPAEQAIGRSLWEVLPPFQRLRPHFEEVISTQEPRHLFREVFGDPEPAVHNVALFPLMANGIHGLVIRADDITEMERKESQLRQAQKMEIVGTLAGGLGHDFNNVLAGITGALSMIEYKLQHEAEPPRKILDEYLEVISASAQRAADMVQQLLTLSRRREVDFQPLDLNQSLRNVLKICQNTMDKSIDLQVRLQPQPAVVRGDPTQIEQVLLNLAVNAAHAMTTMRGEEERQGGRLVMAIGIQASDRPFRLAHPEAEAERYWVVSVQDDGVGMDGQTRARVFEPFFTTKEKGHGTGLGLAMAYSIVRQHHGFIDVHSEPGRGSTFRVCLPACADERLEGRPAGDQPIPFGSGLVLVVDDEPYVQQMACDMLRQCGYEVATAGDGEEAVQLFRERHPEVRAVLLDMNMPRLSGRDAFLRMQEIDPGVRVVLSSGFREDDRVQSVLNLGIRSFLPKPYTLEKLARAIHEAARP